ncbi:hypothetical protein DC3_58410 [Deinococcus cellulosilyticus NBRC 106333 = KACC 11606]|uniref:Uncharacterized protein n=1 Tax=Deinococcus cellulosilyticus (strain DSM 18568 / NBRC 106333 / KACC 11606 / 5516J-15) TaxID=1223518 RepID=A0A511NCB0_DEIC1|nr:hypothetical protein DC3_58410 [Deinococcus cellulosilyticus NBRC 106333 = KACC 11606]
MDHLADFAGPEIFKPNFGLNIVQVHVFSNTESKRDLVFDQESQPGFPDEFPVGQQHADAFYGQHVEERFQ